MISISGFEKTYVIDLNESTDEVYTLSVDSNVPWNISYVSNLDLIHAKLFSRKGLKINVDIRRLKEDGLIILKNLKKETISILLKPNIEESRERVYTFKLGKHSISGKTISFNVISKENGKTEPWSIIRDGLPINYNINKTKTKLSLTLSMILATEFISRILLRQDNSGKEIEIKLKHTDSDSVELYSTKEAS